MDPSWCAWANIVKCVPWRNVGSDVRPPEESEMDACSFYLEKEIMRLKPVYVVPLGATAANYFIAGKKKISQLRGKRSIVQFPTVRYRYLRMVDFIARRGVQDDRLVQITTVGRERAITRAVEKYGFTDIPTITITVFPTYHPAAILWGNPSAETDILSDLNYLVSRATSRDESKNYTPLMSVEDFQAVVNNTIGDYRNGKIPYVAYDVETTSLNAYDLNEVITTFALSSKKGEAWTVPFEHRESPFKGDVLSLNAIRGLLNNLFDEVPVVGHNLKFDYTFSRVRGINIKEVFDDTELQSWTLFNDQSPHDLDTLTSKYTDLILPKQEMKEIQTALPKDERFNTNNYDLDLVLKYNGGDCDSCVRLEPVFRDMLIKEKLYEPHKKIPVAALIPTAEMEVDGCVLDVDFMGELDESMTEEIEGYYKKFEDWGIKETIENVLNPPDKKKTRKFSLSSPEQVSIVLFDLLELEPKKFGKVRKTGKWKGKRIASADKNVLQELLEEANEKVNRMTSQGVDPSNQHFQQWRFRLEVIKTIQAFKKIEKLFSSYVKSLPKKIDEKGYIHPTYGIRHTETGRYNCRNPSLQIIPWHSIIKKAFISRFINGLIVSADHSQMELRKFAMVTGDPELIAAFQQGKDIHTLISSRILQCPESEVPTEERRRIKTVVFGLLYGRGDRSVAAQEGISVERAKEIRLGIFKQFKSVGDFIRDMHSFVYKHGYVPYINGFRRIIPLTGSKEDDGGRAGRQAVNSPIQGPASDMSVVGMINVYHAIKKLGFYSKLYQFVHDSLGYDTPAGELFDLCRLIIKEMQLRPATQFDFINVPLKVDFEVGVSWGHLANMALLSGRQAKFEGTQEYMDLLLDTMSKWDSPPGLVSKSNLDKENNYAAVLEFQPYRKSEPVCRFEGLTTVAA